MRSLLVIPVLAAALAPALAAQNPRASQQSDGASMISFDPVLASAGNLSAAAWCANPDPMTFPVRNDVTVATSDGTGVTWSAGTRIDGDNTVFARKDMTEGGVQIVGNSIYVLWKDERNGSTFDDLFFNYSNDGGATWVGEQRINVGAVGVGAVRDWQMSVAAGSPNNSIYIGYGLDADTASNEALYVIASTDGGATFGSPVHVPQGAVAGASDVDSFDIGSMGPIVFVTWHDNRGGSNNDTWFQRSTDSGATWLAADVQLNTAGDDGQFAVDMAVRGRTVAVAWAEEPGGSGNEVLTVNVSTDGGNTFGGPMTVGGYTPGTDDVDNVEVAIAGNGNVVATWEDDRSGGDEMYAGWSTDGGASWNDTQVSSSSGGFPRIIASGASTEPTVAIAWTGGAFPEATRAAVSIDGGVTWQPDFDVSDTTGDADFAEMAINDLYNNVLVGWLSDDLGANNAYLGGFRPQSVNANGWGTCPPDPTLSFDLSLFGSTDVVGFVVLSAGTGPVTLPGTGGLAIGLSPDPLFFSSLFDPVTFNTVLAGGAGSTLVLPNPFPCPTGVNIFYAAIAFDASSSLTKITDTGSFQL